MTLTSNESAHPAHIYAHPDYWDHALGDGDAIVVQETLPSKGEIRQAEKALQQYAQRPGAGLVISSYSHGDAFSAEGHTRGTLLGIDVEYLYAENGAEIDPAEFKTINPPKRLPASWPVTKLTSAHSDLLWYTHAASGSLVLEGSSKAPRKIVGAHLGSAIMPGACPFVRDGYVYHPTEFIVGEVQHLRITRTSKPYTEVLSRINRVDVLAPGATQTKRKTFWLPGMQPRTHGSA